MEFLRPLLIKYGRVIGPLVALLGLLIVPAAALAVDLGALSVGLIGGADLIGILSKIVDLILLIAGIVAFFYVLYGGFLYLTAGGDSAGVGKARMTITNALIGIIIIAISYALVLFVVNQTKGSGALVNGVATPAPQRNNQNPLNNLTNPRAVNGP